MKFNIQYLPEHKRWHLSYYDQKGKQVRRRYDTQDDAVAEKERVLSEVEQCGSSWLALTPNQRTEAMTIIREVEAAGLNLRQVWEDFKRGANGKGVLPKTLKEAYTLFIDEAERAKLSVRRLGNLRSVVKRFVAPREEQAPTAITKEDVVAFLKPYDDDTFNTYLTITKTFFTWCEVNNFIGKGCNPAGSIAAIDRRRMAHVDEEPHILTVEQCKSLLRATLETDKALAPYVALCLFAGLRPEREGAEIEWKDINGEIHVSTGKAKTRRHRHVPIHPTLRAWLDLTDAEGNKGDLPVANRRRRFEAVRAAAGLIQIEAKTRAKIKGKGEVKIGQKITNTGWAQDCMRHTFASCYYVTHGEDNVIRSLGHQDAELLYKHYRALISKEQSEAFWALTPEAVTK